MIVSRGINGQEWNMLVRVSAYFWPLKFSSQHEQCYEQRNHLGNFGEKRKELKQDKQLSSVKWKMGFLYRMSDELCRKHSSAKALGPVVLVWLLSGKMGQLVPQNLSFWHVIQHRQQGMRNYLWNDSSHWCYLDPFSLIDKRKGPCCRKHLPLWELSFLFLLTEKVGECNTGNFGAILALAGMQWCSHQVRPWKLLRGSTLKLPGLSSWARTRTPRRPWALNSDLP